MFLELSGLQNPSSTADNSDFLVSTFDQSQSTIEVASGLQLVSFGPAELTNFNVQPESDVLGAKTSIEIDITVGHDVSCQGGCHLSLSAPYRNPYTTT